MSFLTMRFQFAPSQQAAGLMIAAAVMAMSALLIIPIPLPLRLFAALIAALLFAAAVRKQALLIGKAAVGGLVFRQDNKITVLDNNGSDRDLGEIADAFVSPWLSTVVIRGGMRRYYIVVMADSLPPDEYRHLRILLKARGAA